MSRVFALFFLERDPERGMVQSFLRWSAMLNIASAGCR